MSWLDPQAKQMRLFGGFKQSLVTVDGRGKADWRDPSPAPKRRFSPAFVQRAAGSEWEERVLWGHTGGPRGPWSRLQPLLPTSPPALELLRRAVASVTVQLTACRSLRLTCSVSASPPSAAVFPIP